jgi:hypothetical protein
MNTTTAKTKALPNRKSFLEFILFMRQQQLNEGVDIPLSDMEEIIERWIGDGNIIFETDDKGYIRSFNFRLGDRDVL